MRTSHGRHPRAEVWLGDALIALVGLTCYLAAFTLALKVLAPGSTLLLVAPSVGVSVLWLLLTHGRRCWQALVAVTAGCALMIPATGLVAAELVPVAVAAHTLVALGVRWAIGGRPAQPVPAAALDLTLPVPLVRLVVATLVACLVTSPLVLVVTSPTATAPAWLMITLWCTRNLLAVLLIAGTGLLAHRSWRARRSSATGDPEPLPLTPRAGGIEQLALLVVSVALAVVALWADHGLPLAFLVLIAVAWAGVRLSPLAAALFASLTAVAALSAALAGRGGVEQVADPLARAFTVQAFVGLVWLLGVGISLAMQRQARLSADLDSTRARLHRVVGGLDDLVWSVEVLPQRLRLDFVSEGSPTGLSAHAGLQPGDDLVAALLGRTPEADHAAVRDFHERLLREETAEVEVRLLGLHGRARWTWWRGAVRHEAGRTVADGTAVDVTERRRLDDLRTQFIAIAGHELRTPLTAVLGYSELLTDDLPRGTDAARWAGAVTSGAERLKHIVDEFFDLARFDDGGGDLAPAPVPLREVTSEVLEQWRPRARTHEIAMRMSVEAAVTAWVDPRRLRQALDNLVANALKYGHVGGRVVVVVGRDAAGRATVQVDDDGIGVETVDLPHLFERFFRTENARAHTVDGSGLGLSVVKTVVEACGGDVVARHSHLGGLSVRISLPAHAPDTTPAPTSSSDAAIAAPLRSAAASDTAPGSGSAHPAPPE
ncbi:ATP-binding protein [Nocardioides nanhaiensis]|uniref:histidine kinase n=1 Tax=Nocardioides nanhaiensis TaxID=1476871 RepID=A0ABP8VVP9_9ACTN